MRLKLGVVLLMVVVASDLVTGQLAELANEIYGPNSVIRGVKNVMGGVLAADKVHKNCLQKTICNEFSDEVVEMEEEVDPVKRTIVYVPKVVKPKGRLRWIGDAISTGVGRVADKLGLNPWGFRRRQGGPPPTLAAKAVEFVVTNWNKIPLKQIFHVMDLGVDLTDTMSRKGSVYPWVKSGVLGYGYGHRRDDSDEEYKGVCAQIAPDCGDWWSQIETVNSYDGGAITRKVERTYSSTNQRSGAVDPNDPLVWNNLRPEHILLPKVFLCKAGLFLEKLNGNMGGDGVVKEKFGPDEFQNTCDPSHLNKKVTEAHDAIKAAGDNIDIAAPDLDINDIEIIDAREQATTRSPLFNETEEFGGLPILVFEGLPSPGVDQSEEQLVESVLRLVNVPKTAVRTALRLPVRARGRDIVLVEMENEEESKEILDNKDKVRNFRSSLVKVGIRRAKYKEMWKYVRQLTVVKELQGEKEDDPLEAEEASEADNEVQDEDDDVNVIEDDDNAAVVDVERVKKARGDPK